MSKIVKIFCLIETTLLLVGVSAMFGKTTGKIAGTVVSAESGEALAGATVSIVGQSIVTVTDLDGEFYILNLPASSYDLAVELIGYKTEVRSTLKVLPDLTTPVEIELIPVSLQMDSVVTVVAERPLIQKDMTASARTISREELDVQPNSRNIGQVVLRMNGAVSDNQGGLHVRGGRFGEVNYYFDGMPVQDQFSGGVGTRINPDALETVSLTTGGYSAEYGEALSGVVNALTQEGTSRYAGKMKLADGLSKPYNVNTGNFDNTRRTDNYYGVFNLSGPLPLLDPERANFFNSLEYWNDGGYLPHSQSESWTLTSKLSLRPMQNLKLTLYTNLYDREQQRYEHRDVNGYSYDFALENSGLVKNDAARFGGNATVQLSASTMMSFKAGYFETTTKRAPDHLFDLYWDEWPGYSVDPVTGLYDGSIQDNYRTDSTYYYTGYVNDTLFNPYYLYRKSSYKSVGFDMLSQVDKHHQLSFGGEYRQNRLVWDNKQFFNDRPYGEKYDVGPSYAAAYLQDKIELGYMIINAGLRLDYLNAEVNFWEDPATKQQLLRSKSKTHVSPRLGFSHPVSDNTLFHANYGYYYQVPQYPYMFTNLQADLTTGFPIVGNPDMEPERTISYEMGVTQKLDEDIRLNATTYYKDVSNLISAMFLETPSGGYTKYVNGDYGSVKGLDLALTKTGSTNLNGSINYSYMIAEGNSSSATEFYYDYFTRGDDSPVMPVQEFPLAFDQRHTLNVNVDFRMPRNQKAELFGVTVPTAWGLNAFFTYGSGMPYTRTDEQGNRLGGLNEGRMPANYRVDMRFDKDFYPFSSTASKLRFFVEVTNLFDRRNVVNVYSRTGLADADGYNFELTSDPAGEATAEDVNQLRRLLAKDPQNFDAPRSVQWGLEWIF